MEANEVFKIMAWIIAISITLSCIVVLSFLTWCMVMEKKRAGVKNNWKEFRKGTPHYGDLIIIDYPPEQMTIPSLVIFDKDTEWVDGCEYLIIKEGYDKSENI